MNKFLDLLDWWWASLLSPGVLVNMIINYSRGQVLDVPTLWQYKLHNQ